MLYYTGMAEPTGLTLAQYLDLPELDQPWLVEPFIPVGGTAVLYGAAKSRKSFLSLQLSMDLACGRPWLGFATRPARVFYLQLDTPRSLWRLRMKRLAKQGVTLEGEAASRMILADMAMAPFPFDIRHPISFAWLRDRMSEFTPDLVIVDTLSKAHGANEDNRTEMEVVIGQFQAAVKPAALLLVTHGRKPKPDYDGGALHELRGSSAIVGAADSILRLMRATKSKPHPRIEYEGRATESGELELRNEPSLFFSVDPLAHWKRLIQVVLMEDHPSLRAAARSLQERALAIDLHKSEDACRKALERGEGE